MQRAHDYIKYVFSVMRRNIVIIIPEGTFLNIEMVCCFGNIRKVIHKIFRY